MSGGRLDEDVIGLGFTKSEMIPAELNLDRVAKWRRTDESEPGTGQQAHFTEPEKRRAGGRKFADDGGGADRQFGELHGGELENDYRRPSCSTRMHIAALWLSAIRVSFT